MDITRAFQTSSDSILGFFDRPGIGYYIPLYQRDYSWDKENIDQLMDDICSGVLELQTNKEQIHFMGTIILVTEDDISKNIQPQDHRAIPPRIDNIIDGQQRISTISLLACCLYQEIYEIQANMNKINYQSKELGELQDTFGSYFTELQALFSFDLLRGNPKRKPILIRGGTDAWTLDGKENENYKSDVSSYLANFIKKIDEDTLIDEDTFPKLPNKSSRSLKHENNVEKNIKVIKNWLTKVKDSHKEKDENNYPHAWDIIDKINQSELWDYERPKLTELINNCKTVEPQSLNEFQNYICSLVQLFAFSSYLLKRCCFTIIKPISQVRAFDMFQSLNATGTPLTAIETFKPLVVNIADSNGQSFKGSNFDKSFTKIEDLMKNLRSASSKNERTNEYLTLFSSTYEGKSLLKQFSKQRQWLINQFQKGCSSQESIDSSMEDKKEFIGQMGKIATYCKNIIYSDVNLKNSLPELNLLEDEKQRKIASFCLVYLKDARHKIAHTILSIFYTLVIENTEDDDEQNKINYHFAVTCKVIASFYTLWRSALPNDGLDGVYRDLLQRKMSWQKQKGNNALNTEELKEYFRNALQKKGIGNQNDWKSKAVHYLTYDNNKTLCKFVLFITSNDTICDSQEPGLMKIGTKGVSINYLEHSQWNSPDLGTLEHIAPQKAESNWDEALYVNNKYHQIGNLTLLPREINISASNKGWIEKWIYYQHLAENDPDKLEKLKQKAEENHVELENSTIELLKKASYANHIKSIVELGVTGQWDKAFVEKRTERICDILWTRMYEWLS